MSFLVDGCGAKLEIYVLRSILKEFCLDLIQFSLAGFSRVRRFHGSELWTITGKKDVLYENLIVTVMNNRVVRDIP
ncbi:hypothetical protein ACH5RR_032154 [Cinchona calisaya]|uniref:Uncharacterized protein n=1 Tax=Cinchona calisaya TaxID=153742 RepID=A0ABD2YHA3_9GENT